MDLFLLCCKHCPNCIQCFIQMEMYFPDLSMGNLKGYLSLRGLSTTGRKVELVARALSAFEMKLPVQVSQEQHLASLQREFQDRLPKYDLSDPKSSDTTWVDDMTKWPPQDLGKKFAYILSNKEFVSDYIEKYKDEKAYCYWKSNFVGTILYADNKDGKCVLQCKVTPSQRIREDPREVWVALKKDGTVLCGWCTCWHECNMQPHNCIAFQDGICIHPWSYRSIMYVSPLRMECINQERCAARKDNGHANQKRKGNNWK